MNEPRPTPLAAREVRKVFRRETGEEVTALDGVSFEVRRGTLTALVGPDGGGKTTLIRLAAGLMAPDAGRLDILGVDVVADPQYVQDRIGYMPQRFGLYEDLSVQQNLDLYAEMHGISDAERRQRYPQLMEMTALGPFRGRLAGRLSGGMKQKLGLACALVRSPELMLLDEPTVGVDPLSRRELWEIVLHLAREEGLTVLVSTSYLDEAERCDHTVVFYAGKVLAQGAPGEVTAHASGRAFLADVPAGSTAVPTARALQARLLADPGIVDAVPQGGRVRFVSKAPGSVEEQRRLAPVADTVVTSVPPRFEDGFMVLLHAHVGRERAAVGMGLERRTAEAGGGPVVEVRDLVRRFGAFTAVDGVSFDVRPGEIFGLLGPNGAGKTTTFRILCGLLPATSGSLKVAGADLRTARASARQRIGYVAQKFSLYGPLTVNENLEFFASAYGLRGPRKAERIAWAIEQFELTKLSRLASEQLPGGYKQRLAMAAALLHEPDILFLDEATSGADPMARREFWGRINALAEQGVTVIITTHFMEEAEYCDRVMILDAGRRLAEGTPAEVRGLAPMAAGREGTMEDAFIAVVEEARRQEVLSRTGDAA